MSRQSEPAQEENWDDDFEFNAADPDGPSSQRSRRKVPDAAAPDPLGLLQHPSVLANRQPEAGPSTPRRILRSKSQQEENWDDDFEDPVDGPPSSSRRGSQFGKQVRHLESWDDDFEDYDQHRMSRGMSTVSSKRIRQYDDSDDDGELGFLHDDDQDHTVTARSRRAAGRLSTSLPPPVPPLPAALLNLQAALNADNPSPFPRSPTASVFSVPTTHRDIDSMYDSRSHLALHPSMSDASRSFPGIPPSPPIQRERRRLRKKSRPVAPDHTGMFVLRDEDEEDLSSPPDPPPPPSTPPRAVGQDPSPSSNGVKSPLLTRIGSVKRWGVRRKRASTHPSEAPVSEQQHAGDALLDNVTPRAPSSLGHPMELPTSPTPQKSKWFSRSNQQDDPNPDVSLMNLGQESPSGPAKRKSGLFRRNSQRSRDPSRERSNILTHHKAASRTSLVMSPRRPTSMQPTTSSSSNFPLAIHHIPSTSTSSSSQSGSRHVSHAGSMSRSASRGFMASSVEDLCNDKPQALEPPRSGRRISFGKAHTRAQSLAVPNDPPTSIMIDTSSLDAPSPLLPPIELHPPSPPRGRSKGSDATIIAPSEYPQVQASKVPIRRPSHSPSEIIKMSTSPHTASLGRSTQNLLLDKEHVPRRNSLGDLKIPARISQAQVGLRRDLSMVREFAASVEQLKLLQGAYHALLDDAQTLLDNLPAPEPSPATAPPRSASAAFFQPRSRSRQRTSTNPTLISGPRQDLNDALVALGMKYRIYWECADILIELGGGGSGSASGGQHRESTSALAVSNADSSSSNSRPKGRERAVTLAGDESKPQPLAGAGVNGTSGSGAQNPAWRASTGRHDLNTRQLVLLKEMLGSPDPQASEVPTSATSTVSRGIPSPGPGTMVNRQWKWGDVMGSTLTLPSEESTTPDVLSSDQADPQQQKKRISRVAAHMRDMLRLLKRKHDELPQTHRSHQQPQIHLHHHQPQQPQYQQFDILPPRAHSAASASTESSYTSHSHTYTRQIYPQPRAPSQSSTRRPRAKTSTGPESVSMREHDKTAMTMGSLTHAQFSTTSFTHKSSPRRPSLSSIFRFSQKGKTITSLNGNGNVSDQAAASRSQVNLSVKVHHGKESTTEEEDFEEEEDWDHLDSASDIDHAGHKMEADGSSTLKRNKKGRSPYLQDPRQQQKRGGSRPVTPNQSQNPSQSSLFADTSLPSLSPHTHLHGSLGPRTTRLSNVEEMDDEDPRAARSRKVQSFFGTVKTQASPGRLKARRSLGKTDSIRSVPAQPTIFVDPGKLAMTPENIKPLLQNAKEVHARLQECMEETKALLANVSASNSSPAPASAQL